MITNINNINNSSYKSSYNIRNFRVGPARSFTHFIRHRSLVDTGPDGNIFFVEKYDIVLIETWSQLLLWFSTSYYQGSCHFSFHCHFDDIACVPRLLLTVES